MGIISIDPGINGAIAWTNRNGITSVQSMPQSIADIKQLFQDINAIHNKDSICYLENVGGYMPGNSGPASVKFARHVGNLEAILYCVGIPTKFVSPGVWMKTMAGIPKGSENKKARKHKIKELMEMEFPYLKFTLPQADALGILSWAMKQAPAKPVHSESDIENARDIAQEQKERRQGDDGEGL